MLFIIFYSAFYFPDTLLNRPHPILWRIVQGMSCIYLMVLVLLLEVDSATAKQIVKYLDPTLIITTTTKVVYGSVWSISFSFPIIRRTLGWWFKMLIFRNIKLCMFVIAFYFTVEVSFRISMQIPFEWFNLVVIDFLVCGIVGITLGYYTCQYLEGHTKKWFSKNYGSTSLFGRIFELFHPNVWWNYEWKIFKSATRLLQITWLIVITQMSELNSFLIVNTFKVSERHWLFLIRITFLAFLAMISIKEYYEFINSK
jgi:hypothetical protein